MNYTPIAHKCVNINTIPLAPPPKKKILTYQRKNFKSINMPSLRPIVFQFNQKKKFMKKKELLI